MQSLLVEVDLRALAPEQVLDLHVAQVVDADLPEEQLVEAWRHLHLRRVLTAQFDDLIAARVPEIAEIVMTI